MLASTGRHVRKHRWAILGRLFRFRSPPAHEQVRIVEKLEELLDRPRRRRGRTEGRAEEAGEVPSVAAEGRRGRLAHRVMARSAAAVRGRAHRDWRSTARTHPRRAPHAVGSQAIGEVQGARKRTIEGVAGRSTWIRWLPEIQRLPELPPTWVWATLDSWARSCHGVRKGHEARRRHRCARSSLSASCERAARILDLARSQDYSATEQGIEELSLQDGDVLFNECGDRDKLGARPGLAHIEVANCIHQQSCYLRMRLYLRDMLPEFVSHHGNTFGKAWFQSAGKQTTNLASINMGMLRAFPVPRCLRKRSSRKSCRG